MKNFILVFLSLSILSISQAKAGTGLSDKWNEFKREYFDSEETLILDTRQVHVFGYLIKNGKVTIYSGTVKGDISLASAMGNLFENCQNDGNSVEDCKNMQVEEKTNIFEGDL